MSTKGKVIAGLVGVVFIALVVWTVQTIPEAPAQPEPSSTRVMSYDGNTISEEKDGRKIWELTAEHIEMDLDSKDATLTGVTGHFYAEDGRTVDVQAAKGHYTAASRDVTIEDGLHVFAWHDCTPEEYDTFINKALDIKPDFVIDDGGDLVHMLHTKRRELLSGIVGGSEETTTGVHRLRALANEGKLEFPMIAANDAYCKYLFDNRYGTGQSTWDGIMRTTNVVIAGKNVVIAGYGWCGKGGAMRARGLGANVIVTEVDPIKAIEAVFDGFRVMPMDEAAKIGDIFLTLTGDKDVIRKQHFEVMKNGAILANSGHFDVEINIPELESLSVSRRPVRKNIEEFKLKDGRKIYLLAEGRLVNLAAGDGHPAEIMDLSFGVQFFSALHLLHHGKEMAKGVHLMPEEINTKIAEIKLKASGIAIDALTPEQKAYLNMA